MINCNPSFLHLIKYAHVYIYVTFLFYLNMSKYKFPMLIYLRYRLFENNYNTYDHSCKFPLIKIQMIHFYSISKTQYSYKNSYQINRNV